MPNWCYQHLTVTGPSDDLKAFRKSLNHKYTDKEGKESEVISLNHLYPIPQELQETVSGFMGKDENGNPTPEQVALEKKQSDNIAKYGVKDWYDWANEKWGTKWGACDVDVTQEPMRGQMNIYFESAWSPAIGLLKEISRLNPTLVFAVSFDEEANLFAGWSVFFAGKHLKDASVDTELTPKLERRLEEAQESGDDDRVDEMWEIINDFRLERMDQAREDMAEFVKGIRSLKIRV